MSSRCSPMETCAAVGISQLHRCTGVAEDKDHLCVTALTCPEERGVAIGVYGVKVGRVLKEKLDTASMPREGGSVECWEGRGGDGREGR